MQISSKKIWKWCLAPISGWKLYFPKRSSHILNESNTHLLHKWSTAIFIFSVWRHFQYWWPLFCTSSILTSKKPCYAVHSKIISIVIQVWDTKSATRFSHYIPSIIIIWPLWNTFQLSLPTWRVPHLVKDASSFVVEAILTRNAVGLL